MEKLVCNIEGIDFCQEFNGGLGRISAKTSVDNDEVYIHMDFIAGDAYRQVGLVMPPSEFDGFKLAFCNNGEKNRSSAVVDMTLEILTSNPHLIEISKNGD